MGNDRRAMTDEQKRQVMERILAAWIKSPKQRLGQIIMNAVQVGSPAWWTSHDLFACEDETIADVIEAFVARPVK